LFTLSSEKLADISIPLATGWLLGTCMEARGKQDLWIRQKPEALEVLREQAIVQSVESSNRIEGVSIAPERLRPVVLGKARPRDRSEEELAGYRKALDWILSRKRAVTMEPEVARHLHRLAQGGFSGDAGEWKKRDNEIIEILPSGDRKTRFVPISAKDTPKAMERLCRIYEEESQENKIPPLLSVATFVFDFLCVHPFRDGNGRVSRLLTTLLLQANGFEVSRFVSLERLTEQRKEEYYQVLGRCSQGWQSGTNEIIPWWNFFLSVLREAYQEFASSIEQAASRPAKSDLVRRTILSQVDAFTLSELSATLPTVSSPMIKKILADLSREGLVQLTGRGRGARWRVIRR